MAKVTIRKGDTEFEINDLTFEQVKELVGVNGYGHHAAKPARLESELPARIEVSARRPDYMSFLDTISDRGRIFVTTLKQHPDGIEANALAGKLGYKDARQIGGLTGGGLAKAAKKHSVRLKDVYRAVIAFPEGRRTVTFFPGRLVLGVPLEQQKPAV